MRPRRARSTGWTNSGRRCRRDHMTMWNFHEPSWREYRSSAWYVDRLRQAGVPKSSTGRRACRPPSAPAGRNGNGPVVAGYAEYDAVPGQSQAPVPHRKPRDGVPATSPPAIPIRIRRSACGRSPAFWPRRHAMERHGIGGTLVFFGEPAEKMCALEARPCGAWLLSTTSMRRSASTRTPSRH